MVDGKLDARWPGANERLVVEEMTRDKYSEHWEKCSKFVEQLVYIKAKNIPASLQEEIVQDVMYKVAKYLAFFECRCTLRTWLNLLLANSIIDVYRRLQNQGQFVYLSDLANEYDNESEIGITNMVRSAESMFVISDELRNAVALLLEYANTHAKAGRNRVIIQMVILDEHPYAEIAKVVGCSPAVVGYVVREAQRYIRENMLEKW